MGFHAIFAENFKHSLVLSIQLHSCVSLAIASLMLKSHFCHSTIHAMMWHLDNRTSMLKVCAHNEHCSWDEIDYSSRTRITHLCSGPVMPIHGHTEWTSLDTCLCIAWGWPSTLMCSPHGMQKGELKFWMRFCERLQWNMWSIEFSQPDFCLVDNWKDLTSFQKCRHVLYEKRCNFRVEVAECMEPQRRRSLMRPKWKGRGTQVGAKWEMVKDQGTETQRSGRSGTIKKGLKKNKRQREETNTSKVPWGWQAQRCQLESKGQFFHFEPQPSSLPSKGCQEWAVACFCKHGMSTHLCASDVKDNLICHVLPDPVKWVQCRFGGNSEWFFMSCQKCCFQNLVPFKINCWILTIAPTKFYCHLSKPSGIYTTRFPLISFVMSHLNVLSGFKCPFGGNLLLWPQALEPSTTAMAHSNAGRGCSVIIIQPTLGQLLLQFNFTLGQHHFSNLVLLC